MTLVSSNWAGDYASKMSTGCSRGKHLQLFFFWNQAINMNLNRRTFIGGMGACAALASVKTAEANGSPQTSATAHTLLPPWEEGMLEFHHISTGRGNATYIVCPDGTTMLIDAGAIYDPLLYTIAPKPDGSRRPGEWIARYIQRRQGGQRQAKLDYALLTHFHGDHIGQSAPGLPRSHIGGYQLTGISDVAETITIEYLIDRDYPDYVYPQPHTDAGFLNYRRFIEHRLRSNQAVAALQVGAADQIVLRRRKVMYPNFQVDAMARNGFLANRDGRGSTPHFPALPTLSPQQLPSENMCSLAVRIRYGDFVYYSGGDLTNDTDFGKAPWRDIETAVAEAVGPVSIAVANHHGYVNGMGPQAVSALRPRAFVVFAWDSAHPTISPLFNMLSHDLYSGDRSIYGTSVKPENAIATRDIAKMASTDGHVVVRVSSGGTEFSIYVLDNNTELDSVVSLQGPFQSRRT